MEENRITRSGCDIITYFFCIITENMLLYKKICYKETPYEKRIRAVFRLRSKNSRIQE